MTSTMERKDITMEITILEENINTLKEIAKLYHGISALKIHLDINELILELKQVKRRVEQNA